MALPLGPRPTALLIARDPGTIYLLRRFLDACGLDVAVVDHELAGLLMTLASAPSAIVCRPPLVVFDIEGPLTAEAHALVELGHQHRVPLIICSWERSVPTLGAASLLQKPLRFEPFRALLCAIVAESSLSFNV